VLVLFVSHELDEASKGRRRRAGRPRFGVVLDAERRLVEQPQPLHDVVVSGRHGDLGASVRGVADLVHGASTAKPWLCAVISTLPVPRPAPAG